MQRADFPVLLDACVLAPFSVCDLLLRLAETPRLYLPRWSARILEEAQRAQQQSLRPPWPKELSDRWRQALETCFPQAAVTGFDQLEPALTNHAGDRHVLAAAIRAPAEVIVTFNLRHFRRADLEPWGITACHPAEYLVTLYELDPGLVVKRIVDIAGSRGCSPETMLARFARTLPAFAEHVAEAVGWELPALPPRPEAAPDCLR